MNRLKQYCLERTEAMVADLRRLVEMESPSLEKPLMDALGHYLAKRLEELGLQVEIVSQERYGNHLVARRGQGQEKQVLILCHMDTVWASGTALERPFRMEGGRAYGPGAYDMKGGIVIALHALEAMRALGLAPKRPLYLIVNSDEEIGSPSSRALIEAESQKSEHVLVLEPALPHTGALKTSRKGVGDFHLCVFGRAAHAGADPQRGVSAILELAHQVLKLHALTDHAQGTTVNVGVVRGGSRSNVVADFAEAHIDVRANTPEEAYRITREILGLRPVLPNIRLELTGGIGRPPMPRLPQIVALYERVRAIGQELGLDLLEGTTGGGSDGNLVAALGVPVVDGLGVRGNGAHAREEYALVDSLPERAALLATILQRL